MSKEYLSLCHVNLSEFAFVLLL